jgi:beta-glucuronidase
MLMAMVVALLLHGGAVLAQVIPEGPVLAAADLRDGQDLGGTWTWSIDPYRDGLAGFHGEGAGLGHRRWDDTDVGAARAANPLVLYEYDMDRSPTATLPSSWLTHAAEMRHYQGLVWYQRRFDAQPREGERQFVRFGAVNYAAQVWLNGQYLGAHRGGFTPFAFEVTGLLRPEGNRLVVGVDSTHREIDVPPPVTDWETYGGITRAVTLLAVPATYVDDAWVRLDSDGRITIEVTLDGANAADAPVNVSIADLGIALTLRTNVNGYASASLPAPAALQRWSPANPRLYDVAVTAHTASGEDIWRDRVGLRTIAVDGS